MKNIRLALYFVVGLLLGGVSVLSFAETIPATSTPKSPRTVYTLYGMSYKYTYSAMDSCKLGNGDNLQPNGSGQACYRGGTWIAAIQVETACLNETIHEKTSCTGNDYTCPTGQNWTLVGQTCTRPDCAPGETRDAATGICAAPKCEVGANEQVGSGRYAFPYPQPSGVSWCVNNCLVYPGGSSNTVGSTRYSYAYVNGAGGAASTCTSASSEPSAVSTPDTSTPPPCAPGEGAMTWASGKVVCVPGATPGATTPPVKSSSSSTSTSSDGSSKTTTTTNTCTGDGACSTTVTTTVTAAAGGGSGTSGTPGTTTTQTDKPSSDTSDFCAKNPNVQICKGDMNKESTQQAVLGELKKLTTPDSTDDSALKNATHTPESQADLDAKQKQIKDGADGTMNPVSSQQSAWRMAMDSGWFSPVPQTTCAPFDARIGPFQWRFDHCAIAAKLSEMGSYALFFLTLVGTFVMLTGGRKEG